MYAPAEIADVLDFVIPCYAASRPTLSDSNTMQSFVSTLRAASSLDVNKAMIAETTRILREKTPIGSYHLLWENRTEMDDFLHQTGYQRLYCGNQSEDNPCDWTKMKLPASVAENLCIYRWINTKTVTSVEKVDALAAV
ncbi:unnamed protein product [Echinostoma caproni]|uniref:Methyltransferase n=1 Tax=Echinostoma caproni TaxID=27848 RepID=A0A183A650_9TREM|nr:unnamed protein product [Echinostoma caproni]